MKVTLDKRPDQGEPEKEIDFEQAVANLTRVKPRNVKEDDAFDRIDRLMRQRPGR